jgi:alkylation response protein AidB-like acyl-CoA dehydrogenase
MRPLPTRDQQDLASMLRALLAAHAQRPSDRAASTLWKALADAGVFGLATAEEHGGAGGSLSDVGVFCVEAGRGRCPLIVHATVQAALAVDLLGRPEARAAWLPALTSGGVRAATALCHPRDAAIIAPALTARPAGGGWCLTGTADFVPHADLRRAANTAVALLSLDLVGVGEAVLARTVDYTIMRRQFGRPIASFQAAQHLVANMHIALAAARLAGHAAVSRLGRGHTATRETAVARMRAATAATLITLDAHQLHGGMGYVTNTGTDTDLHLWSERARVLCTLGGGADVAAGWLQHELGLAGNLRKTCGERERTDGDR